MKDLGTTPWNPEKVYRAAMLLIAMSATGLSGYFTVTLSGTSTPRILMAVLCAGWFAMFVNTVRDATPTTK